MLFFNKLPSYTLILYVPLARAGKLTGIVLSPFHNASSFLATIFPLISAITYKYLFSAGAYITSVALLPVISVGDMPMLSVSFELSSAIGLIIAMEKAAGSLVAQNSETPVNAPPAAI